MEAVRILSRIYSDEMIAGVLNRAKLPTARGNYWTRALVTSLRFNHEIKCHDAQRQAADAVILMTAGVNRRDRGAVPAHAGRPARGDSVGRTQAVPRRSRVVASRLSDSQSAQAIGIAGGFTGSAKHSQVYLFRRVSDDWVSAQKIDVKHMLKSGNLAEDLHLQPGDMLYVPKNTLSKLLTIQPLIPYNTFRLNFGPY